MSPWPTAACFVSWLALCPDNDISGGRVLWKGMRIVKNRAGQRFRMATSSLHHSQTPLGNYLRRMKTKLGPAATITATAHKIAVQLAPPSVLLGNLYREAELSRIYAAGSNGTSL
jgi:hypothetical protein